MNNRGFLFTIVTLLLFLSIFSLSSIYLYRNKELQTTVTISGLSDKIRYIEDDVVSRVYSELLSVEFGGIDKGSTLNVSFNNAFLNSSIDYSTIMSNYESFVEGTYSDLNKFNVTLINFGNNFTIEPYNSTFEIIGDDIYIYTMPVSPNLVQSITVIADVEGEKQGNCEKPQDDGGSYPLITVTYNYDGGSCTESQQLNPEENNDKNGNQFYMDTKNPTGSVEVKYGLISGSNGVLAVLSSTINANITNLNIEYSLVNEKIKLKGGIINISSVIGDISKQSEIILAEE